MNSPQSTMEPMHTPLQANLTLLKIMLERAKERLEDREWHTLRACLLIYLKADEDREVA